VALADDRKPNDTPKKGLQRHGLDLPQPPTREETLAGMQEKSSEALALTPPMLEFRFRNGDSVAFSYSYLISTQYKKSFGITARYPNQHIQISGRNLNALHSSLVWQRRTLIAESDFPDTYEGSGEFINSINIVNVPLD